MEPPPPPQPPPASDGTPKRTDSYWSMPSPPLQHQQSSVRVRMRKQASNSEVKRSRRIVSDVKKIVRRTTARDAFATNLRLCFRIALGVMLAGVVQTHPRGQSNRQWLFLPEFYYLGGLSWAAVMVIFAASRSIGGAIMAIWQIDVGVAIALLFNFVVFSVIPMKQEGLIQASVNLNGSVYDISLQDWAKIAPIILVFTFIMFVSPLETNLKKFAVSTNLYFMLTIVSPMNPIYPSSRKDLGDGYFGTDNLMKNFAVYCVVGVVGTLISLATMVFPYPIFAIRELRTHIEDAPREIREIMNLIVDAYCFRARDIREMDFFRLKLERSMTAARKRLRAMQELLGDAWWEELVGVGFLFKFNKTMAKQFIQLYARLLKDLNAMKFAIELETCHWSHTALMNQLQRNIYLVQVETNDLLDEISSRVLTSSRQMPAPRFTHLERNLDKLMKKFARLYGELLTNDNIKTPADVGRSMPLNLFLYSFHTLVQTLCGFEQRYNQKNYTTKYRVKNFVKHIWRSFWVKDTYPRTLVVFSLRTTLSVAIGLCFSTFVFAFSSTVPNATAMVAQYYMGGTYGSMMNRLSGLVAGTVLPSIFSFFICKSPGNTLYNLLNNIVLCIWTMLSMYVYYSGSYIKNAGMVSAFMAASVLLEHSCRNQNGNKALSYSSLTENSLGILILMVVELVLRPISARTLLRANISKFLTDFGECFGKVYRHHLAVERCGEDDESVDGMLDKEEAKELRKQIDGVFAVQIEAQAQLLQDASLEPDLWRPEFSAEKYQNVLDACENLLAHLRILVDLVDWHARRRRSGDELQVRQNPATGSISMELTEVLKAERIWYNSQDEYASAVSEAVDTLVTLFDEKFSDSNAEQNALFMQMKEAFRLADTDRSGEVDPHELATLLDKLIPVAARGNVHMDKYVAEFMRLVDRNHDGKVSYAEFMDALNHGFRLELEIYEDLRAPGGLFRQPTQEIFLQDDASPDNNLNGSATTTSTYVPSGNSPAPQSSSSRSIFDKLWRIPSSLIGALPLTYPGPNKDAAKGPLTPPIEDLGSPPLFGGDVKRAMENALLNVESFSIKQASARLRESYGNYLLLQTIDRHVAVDDFIVVSCLICATDEIAARLTSLNTLAAT